MTMDLDYEFQPAFTLMTANLGPGESIKVEPGAMVAQSPDLNIETGRASKGSLIGGFLKSVVGGESFFINTYTAGPSGGWISMAPSSPGDICTFDLGPGKDMYMQGGAFMACSPNVQYDTKFQGAKALFSREGAFFLRAYSEGGPGQVFYCSYGAIKEIEVTPNTPIVVDNGHLVAFTNGYPMKPKRQDLGRLLFSEGRLLS
ncbi:MAG: TIGR00266 family protein [Methanobacteriota archaeon]|nr:MAG: TIGR00266 family protein [Euryarchaeota archaeon]